MEVNGYTIEFGVDLKGATLTGATMPDGTIRP